MEVTMTENTDIIDSVIESIPSGKHINTKAVTRQAGLPPRFTRLVGIQLARHPDFEWHSHSSTCAVWVRK